MGILQKQPLKISALLRPTHTACLISTKVGSPRIVICCSLYRRHCNKTLTHIIAVIFCAASAACSYTSIHIKAMILWATRIFVSAATRCSDRNGTRNNNINYIVGRATRKNCSRRRRYHVWSRRGGVRGRAKQIARLPGRSVLLSARSRRINSFMMTSSIPRDRFVRARAAAVAVHAHTL